MADKFSGFLPPTENYSKLPHQMIEALPLVETVSEMKVILYILRHTWGFQDQWKKITLDEFENGRKDKKGNRMDPGVGLSIPSIRDGLKRAEEHGFIIIETDDRDKARVKKFYSLAMARDETLQSDCKSLSPSSKNLSSDVKESDTRSEKETLERHFQKETEKETAVFPEKSKERTDEEIVADVIKQTKTHKDIFDLSLETVTEREKAGGDYASPPSAGGADAVAEAALMAMYAALDSEPPKRRSNDWKEQVEIFSQALRDRSVKDIAVAEQAGKLMGEANLETPHFANPRLSSFPSGFGLIVGKAKKAAADAGARRGRLDADNVEAQAAFEERRASEPPRVEGDPVWEQAKREIALQMTGATFDAWVRRTYGLGRGDGVYVVVAPDAPTRDWLDSRLKKTAERTLVGILGEAVEVRFEVEG